VYQQGNFKDISSQAQECTVQILDSIQIPDSNIVSADTVLLSGILKKLWQLSHYPTSYQN